MAGPNYRLIKKYSQYTVEEAANRLGVHRGTVREWIKRGLPVCDHKRPTLIIGRDLATFLRDRRRSRRKPCGPDEMFCLRCRCPRKPAAGMADFEPISAAVGNLVALCERCSAVMNRRVSRNTLDDLRKRLDVRI